MPNPSHDSAGAIAALSDQGGVNDRKKAVCGKRKGVVKKCEGENDERFGEHLKATHQRHTAFGRAPGNHSVCWSPVRPK